MPFALVATDILRDPCLQQDVFPAVDSLGFSRELVSPMKQAATAVRLLSMGGGHIDVVIAVHTGAISSGTSDPWAVISEIRSLDHALNFDGVVKSCSVPVLLIIDEFFSSLSDPLPPVPRWCTTYDLTRTQPSLEAAILEVLHSWRIDLLSELECVGYAVTVDNGGNVSVDPAFRRPDAEGDILARTVSLGKLQRSRFLILSKDLLRDLQPYEELQLLLDGYRKIAKQQRTKPEELFQKFFERNPSMIMRNFFSECWARPRLRLPDNPRNYLEPDFVLKPGIASDMGTKWEVLDIKLPDVALVTGKRFHPGFSAKLLRAVQQLRDYRDYFNRSDAAKELSDTFGMQPRNPRLAVLIGRRPDKEEVETIAAAQGQMHMLDIEIITYDEILEAHAKQLLTQAHLLERLGQ